MWTSALILPGQPDPWAGAGLRTSLVAELAEYLGQSVEQVETRCRAATDELARAWQAAAPSTPEAISAFYRQADTYLYDLTWWHTLSTDDSALIQVEALETALAHHARTALDFGSGIGSLGLLLARHGLAVTLAEVNPRLNAYARWRFERRGLRAEFIDPWAGACLRTDSFPAHAFDFIAAVDVFEHLPNPRATLAALAEALRPGGVIFIHLPPGPDAARPMHLWHDPVVLLNHLPVAGLWLEDAAGSTLILRRGEGPRYALNPGLELLPDEPCAEVPPEPRAGTVPVEGRSRTSGGILLSTHPLVAMRLNQPAFGLLARLDGCRTAAEVAVEMPELSLVDVAAFLDDCARRRLVVRHPPALEDWPSVSVIVPARGRPAQTRACVASLLALDYPTDRLEIIVVDDASDPPLAPALAGLPVRILRQETNIGQSAARNLAAAGARGDLLAFIDNDCVANPGWLRALVPHLDDPAMEIVGGRVMSPPPADSVAAFEAVRSPLDMGAIGGEVGPGEIVAYLPTCNLVVRRETWQRLGGFDAGMVLGEDVDFVWRALRAGGRARYAPEGAVIHQHRTRLGALLRRRADYGSSEADLQRRHPQARRIMPLPVVGIALLAALVAWPVSWYVGVAMAALAVTGVVIELGYKFQQLRQAGVRLPARQVIGAVLRAHGAALYHLGANVTRYYGLPLLVAGLLWPPLLLAAGILFLVPPITDHRRLRPHLSLPAFIGLSWLEMGAYQVGVWRGCWKWRTLRPLRPVLRPTAESPPQPAPHGWAVASPAVRA
jgi:mycofactocin system glycosyltransferase